MIKTIASFPKFYLFVLLKSWLKKTDSNTIDESDCEAFWSSEKEVSTKKKLQRKKITLVTLINLMMKMKLHLYKYQAQEAPVSLFHGDSGINLDNLHKDNPIRLFEHFFTDKLVNKIVVETNRYAKQYLNDKKILKIILE